jgi:hypothetical protein
MSVRKSSAAAILRGVGAFAAGLFVVPVATAHADIVISAGATSNMSCSGGLCEPTASDAVLNVSDLESLLASGNVTVTTTGSGVQANNIDVEAPLTWSTESLLALDASIGIAVDRQISVTGQSGLSLSTDGEIPALAFGEKGRVVFQNLSSQLTINGMAYTLVNSVASLASAIASDPSSAYALADDYDASQDGTYTAPPIQTVFSGTFEGLGNTISHLSIDDQSTTQDDIGLFYVLEEPGIIEHVRLARVRVVGGNKNVSFDRVGALVGENVTGHLFHDSATGTVRLIGGKKGMAGGLAGANVGFVDTCFAQVSVSVGHAKGIAEVGGLVGFNGSGDAITDSFATGRVTGGDSNQTGGLVGFNDGTVENSYATGAVTGGARAVVGGLIGLASKSDIEFSYSTGAVSGGPSSVVGGFAGANIKVRTVLDNYWDTTTSGTTQGVGKGSTKNVTGLTTQQLQSRLPHGFDRSVWGEKKSINNGLPYLLANPPSK